MLFLGCSRQNIVGIINGIEVDKLWRWRDSPHPRWVLHFLPLPRWVPSVFGVEDTGTEDTIGISGNWSSNFCIRSCVLVDIHNHPLSAKKNLRTFKFNSLCYSGGSIIWKDQRKIRWSGEIKRSRGRSHVGIRKNCSSYCKV